MTRKQILKYFWQVYNNRAKTLYQCYNRPSNIKLEAYNNLESDTYLRGAVGNIVSYNTNTFTYVRYYEYNDTIIVEVFTKNYKYSCDISGVYDNHVTREINPF